MSVGLHDPHTALLPDASGRSQARRHTHVRTPRRAECQTDVEAARGPVGLVAPRRVWGRPNTDRTQERPGRTDRRPGEADGPDATHEVTDVRPASRTPSPPPT